ncbi:hypothetical protein Goshw_002809 [Gossypium schwendimanii]|uniref:RING-type domain-containing protein n=1 Tax=Gossypium schwendimanii TaxID=34291 RepID=A0A7J9KQ06_GOSSC|nr:hypothetical protein [Gossypium schwendimanii]
MAQYYCSLLEAISSPLLHHSHSTISTMAIDNKLGNYIFSLVSIVSAVKWAWSILLRYCLFPYPIPADIGYDYKQDWGTDVECAICLCKIDEDDEIPELRCDHLFHKACLDRWVGSRRFTCPICRTCTLTPPQLASGMQVIVFRYCSFDDSSSHRETWWLR